MPGKTVRSRGSIRKSPAALNASAPRRKAALPVADVERPVQPPVIEDNSLRLGYLIHDVSRMRRTVYDERFKPEGITRSQWWALSNIFRNGGEGILVTELAKLMDVGKVTVGRLVDRLEESGYVYRRRHKSDMRAKKIFVTDTGKRLMGRMRQIADDLNKRISEGLTREDMLMTERHMSHLKVNLRKLLTKEKITAVSEDEAETTSEEF